MLSLEADVAHNPQTFVHAVLRLDPLLDECLFVGVENTEDAISGFELVAQLQHQVLRIASEPLPCIDGIVELVEGTERDFGVFIRLLHLDHVPLVQVFEKPN